jgi:hypothetical protein
VPNHLQLPEPRAIGSRRNEGGASPNPPPPPPAGSHGGKLRGDLARALAPYTTPRAVVEGVDPRRVFKIKASTRLDVNPRGLSLLGDTVDWIYFVVPTDLEATKLHQQLALYESGSGPPVVVDFFGKIDSIGPYGTEDRRGRTLPPPGFDDTKIVDVVLWASPDPATAAQRLDDVDRVLAAFNGQLLASDRRAATTMARVQVTSAGLEALLDLMVVEKVHSPVAPFLEPSDWLQADANALVAEAPLDVVVGVIDDGASAAHPLLAGLIVDQVSIPDGRSWAKPSTHGTMVAAFRPRRTSPSPGSWSLIRIGRIARGSRHRSRTMSSWNKQFGTSRVSVYESSTCRSPTRTPTPAHTSVCGPRRWTV